MITIRKPEIVETGGKTRIQNILDFDGVEKQLWFEVPNEYAQYLCPERADAYVIGVLPYAMRHNKDITCEVPMGEELHYRITTYLIPSLANHSKKLHHIKIVADLDSIPVKNAGGVGTGMSCGVDSMHVLASEAETGGMYPSLKVTHLTNYNVGIHSIGQRAEILHAGIEANATNLANEIGLPIIATDSNFAEVFFSDPSEGIVHRQPVLTHTYAHAFATYMLQKLWKVYFYSSCGHDFSSFTLKNSEKTSPARYELLSLDCFSTQSLKIYSQGGAKSRLEKIKTVITYPPAKKHLNVCTWAVSNCGKCVKCIQILAALDALDQLDEFHEVFDIEQYKSLRWRHYSFLCGERLRKSDIYSVKGTCRILSRKMSILHRLGGLVWFGCFNVIDGVEWFCSKNPALAKRYSDFVQGFLLRKALAGKSPENRDVKKE